MDYYMLASTDAPVTLWEVSDGTDVVLPADAVAISQDAYEEAKAAAAQRNTELVDKFNATADAKAEQILGSAFTPDQIAALKQLGVVL